MPLGKVIRERFPGELSPSIYPGRQYPQRQVAREGVDLSLGIVASIALGFLSISSVIVTADADYLPRPKGLLYLSYVIKSLQSSIFTVSASCCVRFFDFANFRIPLSRFLVDVLEYFRINLSRLSVIVATKISHFEILCRVHGYVPTVGLFCRFYVNSKNKGRLSFSKRSENALVCHTKPLDSLKNWNNSFIWVDASVFPSSIPWYTKKILARDPSPTAAEFSAEACDFLATHPAMFRKFSEPFLCLVGLSRYYDLDDNVYPTFLTDAGEETDLVAFIRHADPTKVRIGERQIEEGKVLLLDSTEGRVIPLAGEDSQAGSVVQAAAADNPKSKKKKIRASGASGSDHPPKKLREDHGTSGDVGAIIGGKSLAALQGLLERSTLAVKVGVTAAETVPFVTSSVTPTPEREGGGNTDFVFGPNLRTQRPSKRFVISLDFSHHSSTNAADAEVTSLVRSFVSPPPVMTAAVTTTNVVGASSLKELIDQGVADALVACDADRSRNGDDSYNSGTSSRRTERTTRECTYTDFLKCQPLNFKGMKGVDVLSQWFQRMEMFPKESDKIKKYVDGLPDMIHGSVMASKPKTMQDAIEIATELMDKKISTLAERQAENKRKLDNNNQAQQQPPKKQGVAIAYTDGSGERKEYAGTLPSPAATNNQRNPTCYECGNQGHYRSDCQKLKNQNHRNQTGGTGAREMVHALGGGENNQDLNNIEDDINA
ncbi:gypsy type transposase [Tanacetum coccineum]